jgi:Zn-dependent protease
LLPAEKNMFTAMTQERLVVAVIWIALFFLVSGPVHECAHAFTAWRMGDGTAKLAGRVTLWPWPHFDPIGGGLLAITALLSGTGFGWAKPTPVNPYRLRGRHAQTWVAAAGPLSNLALAALFAIPFRILWAQGIAPDIHSVEGMLQEVFFYGVDLNVLLMVFNLLPVAPLDGSHVLLDQLDARTSREVGAFMDQYGILILVAVIFLAGSIIAPITHPIMSFLIGVPVG